MFSTEIIKIYLFNLGQSFGQVPFQYSQSTNRLRKGQNTKLPNWSFKSLQLLHLIFILSSFSLYLYYIIKLEKSQVMKLDLLNFNIYFILLNY